MFASVFLANLGSIDMEPANHHLYEYGNIPIFVAAGAVRHEAIADDDGVRRERRLPLRYTFDERIADGLYCASALEELRDLLERRLEDLGEDH